MQLLCGRAGFNRVSFGPHIHIASSTVNRTQSIRFKWNRRNGTTFVAVGIVELFQVITIPAKTRCQSTIRTSLGEVGKTLLCEKHLLFF